MADMYSPEDVTLINVGPDEDVLSCNYCGAFTFKTITDIKHWPTCSKKDTEAFIKIVEEENGN